MNIVFAGQVAKDLSSSPEHIEDVYAISKDGTRVVLCDGASESFDSRTWAELLANKFLCDPDIQSGWTADVLSNYSDKFDYQQMSWAKQASFDRGSFSTLLGFQFFPDDSYVQITGVGDSVAFLLREGSMIDSYPYTHMDEFQLRPRLLSTNVKHNEFVSSPDFMCLHNKKWTIDRDKKHNILMMTDAIAEWVLSSIHSDVFSWESLLCLSNHDELEELVLAKRGSSNMRTDDVTLINIAFEGD